MLSKNFNKIVSEGYKSLNFAYSDIDKKEGEVEVVCCWPGCENPGTNGYSKFCHKHVYKEKRMSLIPYKKLGIKLVELRKIIAPKYLGELKKRMEENGLEIKQ